MVCWSSKEICLAPLTDANLLPRNSGDCAQRSPNCRRISSPTRSLPSFTTTAFPRAGRDCERLIDATTRLVETLLRFGAEGPRPRDEP